MFNNNLLLCLVSVSAFQINVKCFVYSEYWRNELGVGVGGHFDENTTNISTHTPTFGLSQFITYSCKSHNILYG